MEGNALQGLWLVAFGLQWLLILILCVLVAGILRYLGSIQEKIDLVAPAISRFALGERVSEFTLPDIWGNKFASTSWIGQRERVMLLFLNSTCDSCKTVVKQLAEVLERPEHAQGEEWAFLLICPGELVAIQDMVKSIRSSQKVAILHDEGTDNLVTQAYGVRAHPTGMALDKRGRVVDQTFNPHAGWLYQVMGIPEPTTPVTTGPHALIVARSETARG
jgi:hypothetical protein